MIIATKREMLTSSFLILGLNSFLLSNTPGLWVSSGGAGHSFIFRILSGEPLEFPH